MLKNECLTGFNDRSEAAILAGRHKFARLKIYWRAAVGASDALRYRHD